MAKLTKTEQRAFDALKQASGQSLPIDLLVERVYGANPPASARASMTAIMRVLGAKTESGPDKVVRTSGLGRGAMAVYAIKK